ncbi:MAG: 3',5'-cyclic-nucleotide phosphodiesterase [Helicobacteraceae bacterium]|jgi:cAMP phosphodiesterase|nr:3',5'-cyclic-nucleotide phosphodiesterase [Helicobacteraceae bacterium]
MSGITMLGAYGGRLNDKSTTSLLVSDSVAIDAGNLLSPLGFSANEINHIFLTHSHLDHIMDLPFLIDAFFASRDRPINIYGLPHTVKTLKKHIFNDEIWPNFAAISLLNSSDPVIIMREIEPNVCYEVDDVKLTPFKTNHAVESVGYVIEKEGKKIMFTSDTSRCANIWDILNEDTDIASIIIEASFPSDYEKLALDSGHLTPKLLNEELGRLKREDVTIYVNHIKPDFMETLKRELSSFERTKKAIPLSDGALILL